MLAHKRIGIPGADREPLTWQSIDTAILALDGESLTGILIDGPSQACLAVGGGNGTYAVDVSLDGLTWRHLMNPRAGEEDVELIVADQWVRMENKRVATLEDTLKAARSFAIAGEVDGTLTWT